MVVDILFHRKAKIWTPTQKMMMMIIFLSTNNNGYVFGEWCEIHPIPPWIPLSCVAHTFSECESHYRYGSPFWLPGYSALHTSLMMSGWRSCGRSLWNESRVHVVPGRSVKGDSSLGKRTITWGWGEEVEFISSTRCSNVPGTFIRPGVRTFVGGWGGWGDVAATMQHTLYIIMAQRAVVCNMSGW